MLQTVERIADASLLTIEREVVKKARYGGTTFKMGAK